MQFAVITQHRVYKLKGLNPMLPAFFLADKTYDHITTDHISTFKLKHPELTSLQ